MHTKIKHLLASLGLLFTLAACTAAPVLPAATATLPGRLTPYPLATPSVTPSPTDASTPTPLPSPTPTPITYTVKKGDQMCVIASIFKVDCKSLQEANPTVQPNLMSVGTVLIIPASAQVTPTVPVEELSPTPVGLQLGQANCLPEASGGTWCFLPVTNPQSFAVENVTAVLHAIDSAGNPLSDRTAYPPLNLLAPGETLPLMAFYPTEGGQPAQVSPDLGSAVPVPAEPARYLGLAKLQPQIEIAPNGLSAAVSITLQLADPNAQAGQVWLLAVGYDTTGRIVAVRRWESPTPLAAGGSLDAALTLYTAGDAITRVDVLAEARP